MKTEPGIKLEGGGRGSSRGRSRAGGRAGGRGGGRGRGGRKVYTTGQGIFSTGFAAPVPEKKAKVTKSAPKPRASSRKSSKEDSTQKGVIKGSHFVTNSQASSGMADIKQANKALIAAAVAGIVNRDGDAADDDDDAVGDGGKGKGKKKKSGVISDSDDDDDDDAAATTANRGGGGGGGGGSAAGAAGATASKKNGVRFAGGSADEEVSSSEDDGNDVESDDAADAENMRIPETAWFNDMPVEERPMFIPLSSNKVPGLASESSAAGASARIKTEDGLEDDDEKADDNRFVFLQLPDVLPNTQEDLAQLAATDAGASSSGDAPGGGGAGGGGGGGAAASGAAKAKAAETAGMPDLLTDVTFINKMRALGNGRIGKLLRRKSGALELRLGNHILQLKAGTPVNFLQELVAMNSREAPEQLINLGKVTEKYVCSPDIVQLLREPAADGAPLARPAQQDVVMKAED